MVTMQLVEGLDLAGLLGGTAIVDPVTREIIKELQSDITGLRRTQILRDLGVL